MVRTKADGCASSRKVVAARAPRKSLGAGPSSSGGSDGSSPSGKGKYAGCNPACPRPTPDWQKGIDKFFTRPASSSSSSSSSSSTSSSQDSTESSSTNGAGHSSSSED